MSKQKPTQTKFLEYVPSSVGILVGGLGIFNYWGSLMQWLFIPVFVLSLAALTVNLVIRARKNQ